MPDFLLEVGCEEIPARMIDAASIELRQRVARLLEQERLGAGGSVICFDTPRRLAVQASGVPAAQPDVREQITGPSVQVAFNGGEPTPAAHAFARKAGVDVSQLERITTPKGEYLAATVTKKGRSTGEILAENLSKEISSIYWPKSMYWRKPTERFVRPVRWLVAMLDGEVIPLEFDGVLAGNESRGHRILADKRVIVPSAGEAYVKALRAAKVLGRGDREKQIRKDLDAATRSTPGARWREDKNLLDTVVNLTEWPSVILGNFDAEFLELPEEVLVTVMRDHQKYFAIEDTNGKLLPHFLAVLNTEGDPQGIIQHGHERVLRARFNDARFFWRTDQKHPLRERVSWLKHVTFQKDLGSYYEKTMRVQRLCSWLSSMIRKNGVAIRPGVVHKAACLAKTDLTTELVKEFTELQGIVGGLYAKVQELDPDMKPDAHEAVSIAIYDQYKPESMEDSVPRTVEGAVLSIADKADSIAGMFALGLHPTGSKDPFALRRQANGIVKTIAEHKLPIGLEKLFSLSREAYRDSAAEKKFKAETEWSGALHEFFRERLAFYLRDARRYAYDVVNAALAAGSDDIVDVVARAEAVSKVRGSADFESICVAFKRIANILRQARTKPITAIIPIDSSLFTQPERELFEEMRPINTQFLKLSNQGNYLEAIRELSKLRPYVDQFFDKVLVMAPEDNLRENRLALLETLKNGFSTIADFSEIVTEGVKESSK
ncbi:MAG TPA: glycine--tRNA ligase subunit beta [Terriglobales bacterium]|nr:glycine--tRNA ligase subunit beta [Terriglobales bacterium]